MTSRRQTETTIYNKNLHHARRDIAKYYLYTTYKASLHCLTPLATPVRLPAYTPFAYLLFKSVATKD